jgi:preprotein translocase YajC subunit
MSTAAFPILLLFFICVGAIMHFTITRPMRKTHDTKALMLNSIRPGNVICTTDGLRGLVVSVNKADVILTLMPDHVRVRINLEGIAEVENFDKELARELMDRKIQKGRSRMGKQRTGLDSLKMINIGEKKRGIRRNEKKK